MDGGYSGKEGGEVRGGVGNGRLIPQCTTVFTVNLFFPELLSEKVFFLG